jgi:hypothetical protein
METLARPSRIFITQTTMEKLSGRIPCADMGMHTVKGKNEPLHVFAIKDSANSDEMAEMAAQYMQEAGIKEGGTPPPPEATIVAAPPTREKASPAAGDGLPDLTGLLPADMLSAEQQKTPMPPVPPAWVEPESRPAVMPSALPDALPDALPELPASPADPQNQMLQSIDQARAGYVASVKQGSRRNPDLEDWFARFEEFLRPQFEKKS